MIDIAKQIVGQSADYILAVEVNQKEIEQYDGQILNSNMDNGYVSDKCSI